MKKTLAWISVLGCVFWASTVYGFLHPFSFFDIFGILSAVGLIGILVAVVCHGILGRGFASRVWLLPSLLIVAIFWGGYELWQPIQSTLSDELFDQRLPDLTRIVIDVKDGKIKTGHESQWVNNQIRKIPREIAVWAASCRLGTVVVEFRLRSPGGAVGPHEGYLYDDCNDPAVRAIHGDIYDGKYNLYHVKGAWYEFSD